jgi:hypothetical protein
VITSSPPKSALPLAGTPYIEEIGPEKGALGDVRLGLNVVVLVDVMPFARLEPTVVIVVVLDVMPVARL